MTETTKPFAEAHLAQDGPAKRAGGKVIFDSNYRSVLWQSEPATPFYLTAYTLADYLFVTDDDHHGVFGPDVTPTPH